MRARTAILAATTVAAGTCVLLAVYTAVTVHTFRTVGADFADFADFGDDLPDQESELPENPLLDPYPESDPAHFITGT